MKKAANSRTTKQRRLVLEAVKSRCDHPTADEIFADVRKKDDRISRGTVYRNLNVLAENGDITHVKVPSADRYDLRTDLHYHMFCTSCGRVVDAPVVYNRDFDKIAEAQAGYKISRHRMIFEGLCPECRKKEDKKL